MISTKLQQYLDESGLRYTRRSHRTAYTSLEVAESLHVPGREFVKSVMLKADNEALVMAVLSATETVNLDILREEIGCDVLRLATEDEFSDSFPTCKPGAIPPFGNLFGITVYCDADLSESREIEFNAGTYDETIRMTFADYRLLVHPMIRHFAQPYREGVQRLAA